MTIVADTVHGDYDEIDDDNENEDDGSDAKNDYTDKDKRGQIGGVSD